MTARMEAISVSNENLFGDAVKIASGGGGFAAVLLFGRWIINWLTGRYDKVQSRLDEEARRIDERWKAYTRRMEERCAAFEQEVEKCHSDKRDMERRIAALEGFDQGIGDRREEQQKIRALEARLIALEARGSI